MDSDQRTVPNPQEPRPVFPTGGAKPTGYPPPKLPPRELPQPPKPGAFKRGFGAGLGASLGLSLGLTVLSVIGLVMSLISMVAMAGLVGQDGTTTSLTTVWGSSSAKGKLRAIPISGTILTDSGGGSVLSAGTYGYEVAKTLDGLQDKDADGVVLLVNTPGGTITGSKAIADAVVRYRERTENPVMVYISGMSASGGVYSTATADWIVSDYGTMVGSIGVLFGPFQRYRDVVATSGNIFSPGVITTGGITQETFTQGTGKDFGNPYRDMTDAERQMLENMLKPEYEAFVSLVAENRGISKEKIINELGAGMFGPMTAKKNGLIDDVMGREEFFQQAATKAGLDPKDTLVEMYAEPSALEQLLGAKRPLGQALPLADAEDRLVSQQMCGNTQPLTFYGDLMAVCAG